MDLVTPSSGLLFWMTVVFGIVFFILAKFGFPVITGMVGKRTEHIRKSLEEAEKAAAKLEGVQDTCRKMLDDTRMEQAAMLEEARKASARMVEQAAAEAKKQAAHMISEARAQIEIQKQEALADVRNTVVEMAVAVSGKVLRDELEDSARQRELADRIIREMESDNGSL